MTTAIGLAIVCACGAPEGAVPINRSEAKTGSDPIHRTASCTTPTARWRYALIASAFEPTLDVAAKELVARWQAGSIAASDETARALAGVLGPRGDGPTIATSTTSDCGDGPTIATSTTSDRGDGPTIATTDAGNATVMNAREPVANGWAIVPAHELSPAWSVIEVDGKHPIVDDGVLALPVCGEGNIDREKLTTLVMSGTTALTGRTAKRVDDTGIRDTVKHIAPFFRSADLVHVSNEVAFVRGCKPETGQDKAKLKFCSRDRYIELLGALNTSIVELTGSHLTDYGKRSLARTIEMYEKRGWLWFGGGRTQIEASAPRVVEHHGNRFAFVGCNAVNWWVKAISAGLGTANCDWARMKWQIQELRREGLLPIATVQHRELRTHTPAPDLVRDLRGLAEAGAMFVLGSQAHVAHPWDVHHGAYVHYGPGNILFAQYRPRQREATVDKLFVHDGKLLSVAHIYTRTEHGRPRLLTDAERAALLGDLATAAAVIEPPEPWAVPALPPITRERPDSFVKDGRSQRLRVSLPAQMEDGKRYPLVVDLEGTRTPGEGEFFVTRVGGFVVKRGKVAGAASAKDIVAYLRTKYPIDRRAVTITADPTRPERHRHRSRRHSKVSAR